ncbi:uncharacterized protein BROUX77_003846 [Berkeleyomyces rouxiae]|uniref:uncharacterized protein n=1 Tax=Berkeleyomyces rouxiae TaxID=2035830 RepID=UPI003B829103
MTGDRSVLQNYKNTESFPIVGSGGNLVCVGSGSVKFSTRITNGTLKLNNVRHVQGLNHNLISTFRLLSEGGVHFDQLGPTLRFASSGKEVAMVRPLNGVYHLVGSAQVSTDPEVSGQALGTVAPNRPQPTRTTAFASLSLWHRRLGHLNPINIRKAAKHVQGLDVSDLDMNSGDKFSACWKAIAKQQPHRSRPDTRTTQMGDRIHADLIGPITPESVEGFRIKAFHVDGGTEFSATLKRLEEQGTEIRVTPAYTPSSNGLAER